MAMHKPGDLVWAKMKGYPEWPAMVLAPSDVPMSCPSGKHPVMFFGTMETGFMRPAELFSYTKYRDKFEKPRRMKGFTQAVLEIRREAGIEEDLSDRFKSSQSASSSKKKRKPKAKPTPSTAETPSTSTAQAQEVEAEIPDDLTPTPIPHLSLDDVDETPPAPAKSESPVPTPVKELPAPQLVTSSGRKRKPKIFEDCIQFDLAPKKVAVTPREPKQASTPVAVPKRPPVTTTPAAATSNSAPKKSRKSRSSSSKKSKKKESKKTPKVKVVEAERKEERSEPTLEESEAARKSVSPTYTELPVPEDAQNAVPAAVPDAVVHESEQLPEPEEPEATPPAREATPEPEPASHLVPYSDSESSPEGLSGKKREKKSKDAKASKKQPQTTESAEQQEQKTQEPKSPSPEREKSPEETLALEKTELGPELAIETLDETIEAAEPLEEGTEPVQESSLVNLLEQAQESELVEEKVQEEEVEAELWKDSIQEAEPQQQVEEPPMELSESRSSKRTPKPKYFDDYVAFDTKGRIIASPIRMASPSYARMESSVPVTEELEVATELLPGASAGEEERARDRGGEAEREREALEKKQKKKRKKSAQRHQREAEETASILAEAKAVAAAAKAATSAAEVGAAGKAKCLLCGGNLYWEKSWKRMKQRQRCTRCKKQHGSFMPFTSPILPQKKATSSIGLKKKKKDGGVKEKKAETTLEWKEVKEEEDVDVQKEVEVEGMLVPGLATKPKPTFRADVKENLKKSGGPLLAEPTETDIPGPSDTSELSGLRWSSRKVRRRTWSHLSDEEESGFQNASRPKKPLVRRDSTEMWMQDGVRLCGYCDHRCSAEFGGDRRRWRCRNKRCRKWFGAVNEVDAGLLPAKRKRRKRTPRRTTTNFSGGGCPQCGGSVTRQSGGGRVRWRCSNFGCRRWLGAADGGLQRYRRSGSLSDDEDKRLDSILGDVAKISEGGPPVVVEPLEAGADSSFDTVLRLPPQESSASSKRAKKQRARKSISGTKSRSRMRGSKVLRRGSGEEAEIDVVGVNEDSRSSRFRRSPRKSESIEETVEFEEEIEIEEDLDLEEEREEPQTEKRKKQKDEKKKAAALKVKLGGHREKIKQMWDKKPMKKKPFGLKRTGQKPKSSATLEAPLLQSQTPEPWMPAREPGFIETKSRWWLTGSRNRRRPMSPQRQFPTNPLDCAAMFRMIGRCLDHVGERLVQTKPDESEGATEATLDVMLDSLMASMAPLLSLTRATPRLNVLDPQLLQNVWNSTAVLAPAWPAANAT